MENFSLVRQIVLKRPEEFAPNERPTVSLVILVKPGDDQIASLLADVVPHVDEVVFVIVDGDSKSTGEWLHHPSMKGKLYNLVEVNPSNHPELYFKDSQANYTQGKPLGTEVFNGPFTDRYLIADWSKVRNLGWKRCTQEWRMTIDGCDLIANPSNISSACDVLNEYGRDFCYSTYIQPARGLTNDAVAPVLIGRIAKNGCDVHWEGVAEESLDDNHRAAIIEGCLVVVKPSSKRNVESDIELFKTLYANARKCDWQIPLRNLLYMARLANLVGMSNFAEEAITTYLKSSLYTEERAWACSMRGELFERAGNYEQASVWYERSLAEHPGYKSAYRLCHSRFMECKWQECVDAFQAAIENEDFVHFVDDGDVGKSRGLILVAAALFQLDRVVEARACGKTLRKLFPTSETIIRMCDTFN